MNPSGRTRTSPPSGSPAWSRTPSPVQSTIETRPPQRRPDNVEPRRAAGKNQMMGRSVEIDSTPGKRAPGGGSRIPPAPLDEQAAL